MVSARYTIASADDSLYAQTARTARRRSFCCSAAANQSSRRLVRQSARDQTGAVDHLHQRTVPASGLRRSWTSVFVHSPLSGGGENNPRTYRGFVRFVELRGSRDGSNYDREDCKPPRPGLVKRSFCSRTFHDCGSPGNRSCCACSSLGGHAVCASQIRDSEVGLLGITPSSS